MRRILSDRGLELPRTSWKLYWRVPEGSVVFGRGNRFSMALPTGLKRLSGTWLPGKHPAAPAVVQVAPLLGSRTKIGDPFVFTLCEKSPARSSAVGIV